MTPYIQVEWMCATMEEATVIIEILLQKKLVACVNLIKDVESHYIWKGKQEHSKEMKVLLKTHQKHFSKIQQIITEHGSYEVPAINAFPILAGAPTYLQWIEDSISNAE